jgi:hypothetical protein
MAIFPDGIVEEFRLAEFLLQRREALVNHLSFFASQGVLVCLAVAVDAVDMAVAIVIPVEEIVVLFRVSDSD